MPKSRNRKKKQKPQPKAGDIARTITDNSYAFKLLAHRMMQMLGLETSCFDQLNLKLKVVMMFLRMTPVHVRASKTCRVPKPYIRFFNHSLSEFFKNNYIDTTKLITLNEYACTVQSINQLFCTGGQYKNIFEGNKPELIERIRTAFGDFNEQGGDENYYNRLNQHVMLLCLYVSQPHYRVYHFNSISYTNPQTLKLENVYEIESVEPERKVFQLAGERHVGYRVRYYDPFENSEAPSSILAEFDPNPCELQPHSNAATGKTPKKDYSKWLPVYIQVHALNRMAQRLDIYDNMYRNLIISTSMSSPIVVRSPKGQRLLVANTLEEVRVGYFPFSVIGGEILIHSFLPLSSPDTPEGANLLRRLHLKKTDCSYLNMDKLSFYTKTNFDNYPDLKAALHEAGMAPLLTLDETAGLLKTENISLNHFFQKNLPAKDE